MSQSPDANEQRTLSAPEVVSYLQKNPSFFNQHSEVLLDVQIPHVNGGAISLFDRQLATLREENRRLKVTLNDLIDNARSNEALIKKIHSLALLLMEASGPQAIFSTLNSQLCAHFLSDRSRVLIFGQANTVESSEVPEFVGAKDDRRSIFADLLASAEPWCGPVTDRYLGALWPDDGLAGSLALLPIEGGHWHGVLAIHSDSNERFQPEMGTELLRYISDIVALIIDPWVNRSET